MRKNLKYTSLLVAVGMMGIVHTAKAEEQSGGSFWDNTKVTGSLDTSYNYNFNRPTSTAAATATNGHRAFDGNPNSFSLNLFELAIENAPTDWITLRTDLDFGQDAALIHSAGLGAATDNFDLQQAFLAIKAPVGNGLTFKAGKFVTGHGAEVIEAAYNNNISRSFLFNYAIPFTHTGLSMNYAFNDMAAIDLAVLNGWDNTLDNNNGKTLQGFVTLKPVEGFTWILGGTFGPEAAGVDGSPRLILESNGSYAVNEQLTVGLDYVLGRDKSLAGHAGIADWQALAGYGHYKVTDTFALSLRGEMFRDDTTTRLGGLQGSPSTKMYEGTLTSHCYLAEGVDLRFEFRHDQGNNTSFVKGSGTPKKYQDTVAAQLVYSF